MHCLRGDAYVFLVTVVFCKALMCEVMCEFGNFREKFSGNLLITYVNQLFPSPTLQADAVK